MVSRAPRQSPPRAVRDRGLAFLAACRECASRPDVVISLHPQARELRDLQASTASVSLAQVLRDEAFRAVARLTADRPGAPATQGSRMLAAVRYYRARREVRRAAVVVEAGRKLPRLWRDLLGLPPSDLARLVRSLGFGLAASAVNSRKPSEAVALVSRFPDDAAKELLRARGLVSEALAEPAARAVRACTGLSAEAVAEEIGTALLAALYTQIDAPARASMEAIARSNLPQVLHAHPAMSLDAIQAKAAQSLLTELLATSPAAEHRARKGGGP